MSGGRPVSRDADRGRTRQNGPAIISEANNQHDDRDSFLPRFRGYGLRSIAEITANEPD